jgi:hypothetical protein
VVKPSPTDGIINSSTANLPRQRKVKEPDWQLHCAGNHRIVQAPATSRSFTYGAMATKQAAFRLVSPTEARLTLFRLPCRQ